MDTFAVILTICGFALVCAGFVLWQEKERVLRLVGTCLMAMALMLWLFFLLAIFEVAQ